MRISHLLATAALVDRIGVGRGGTGWPTKQPIKVITPFPPGSSLEAIGRPIFEYVARQIGQSYVMEHRPGAGGTIGMAAVAKAEPDGYTLLINSSVHTITPSTYTNRGYDTIRDFAPITPLAQFPNVLVVPMSRYKTIQEMVGVRQGQAQVADLWLGRRRGRDPPQRRAAPAQRRVQGGARSFQGCA